MLGTVFVVCYPEVMLDYFPQQAASEHENVFQKSVVGSSAFSNLGSLRSDKILESRGRVTLFNNSFSTHTPIVVRQIQAARNGCFRVLRSLRLSGSVVEDAHVLCV